MTNLQPNFHFHTDVILKALDVIEEYVNISSISEKYLSKEAPEAIIEARNSMRALSLLFQNQITMFSEDENIRKSA